METTADNLTLCSEIMLSRTHKKMPVVYVSFDSDRIVVSAEYLAKQLNGVAHVIKETSTEFSFKLRMLANSRNAHSGFIGIYFPGELYYELFNISDYRDYRSMSKAIIDCVWKTFHRRTIGTECSPCNHVKKLTNGKTQA